MPTAKELLEQGNLKGAIEEQTRLVKESPSDNQRRTSLFELLCFAGEWDRAEKQLSALSQPDPKAPGAMQAQLALQVYVSNLNAERERVKVFQQGARPHFLRPVPAYVELHIQALSLVRERKLAEARELLDRAEEERPALPGAANGEPFADFRDFDDLVGPVLEVLHNGRYVWLPYEQIRRIEIHEPKKLRDLIWAGAKVEADDGTTGDVFVPALYAGSSRHEDDLVKLGRMTDWVSLSEDLQVGVGLRSFLVDEEDRSIFETKTVEFDERPSEGESAPS